MVRLCRKPTSIRLTIPPGRVCICAKISIKTCQTTAETSIRRGSWIAIPVRLDTIEPSKAPKAQLATR